MRESVCKKTNEKDLQTGGSGLMEGQIRNIRFSQCDSRQVTEVLDRTLDTRDKYLFMTRFRGCRIGYLKGEEYKRMNRGENTSLWSRLKDTLRSGYFWMPMLFSVMFGLGCIAFYYKKIVNKYHSFGILDFSILDRQGEKVMKSEILRDTGTSGNEGTEE